MILIPFQIKQKIKRIRRRTFLSLFLCFSIWYINALPNELFSDSTSTVILDRDGKLLGAHISRDEQWRFQECSSVPEKFKTCIIEFEDRSFESHIGVSFKGVFRALYQNITNAKRVSGGSTITMQVVRLMRKNPQRTYGEKVLEMILATRLEIRCSKKEILNLYASHAPFGNNVVGIDAASWRFFNRPPNELSWSESATLAVLPNAPGLIYPGKNHDALLNKRNRLLKRLLDGKKITPVDYELALEEPLPEKPVPLPRLAPHLLQQCIRDGNGGKTTITTVDKRIQEIALAQLKRRMNVLNENKIMNGAILITEVETGEIVAYIGNTNTSNGEHSQHVDCTFASRSTGSILKPLLYGKSLDAGIITPKMLLLDTPSKFGGFSPKNFTGNYDGLVPADEVLSRSLNIPMVHLLNSYGLSKFHSDLNDFGFTTLKQHPSHYGLSLILGGAEVNLQELSQTYVQLAQKLSKNEVCTTRYRQNNESFTTKWQLSDASIYETFEAMTEVKRPDEENHWKIYSSSQKIAWKTGTSFGFRDAWSVGITPKYVVSVWIGNADGEGRPGLTGYQAAAPLLFDIFNQLPAASHWFRRPTLQMAKIPICSESGQRATKHCTSKTETYIPASCLLTQKCQYHRLIHLNKSGTLQVNSMCTEPMEMIHEARFILPTFVAKFYQKSHPNYQPAPSYDPNCVDAHENSSFYISYPKNQQQLFLPVGLNGKRRKIILEAVHQHSEGILYWHLDGEYLGMTSQIHQLPLYPLPGKHLLTIVEENGSRRNTSFTVLDHRKE